MPTTNCLNCGEALFASQNYCPQCGQKSDTPRITFGYLFHEFLQWITNADKGFLKLLKGLALHPARVATDYVQGKRKSYFSPFACLAICIAFSVFINSWIKPYRQPPPSDENILQRLPDERLRNLYLETVDRNASAQKMFNNNLNIFSVVVAPYFAFVLWVFFRKRNRNRNIPEITMVYILFTAFANLIFSILIAPLLAIFRDTNAYFYALFIGIFFQTLYYVWGLKNFFGLKGFWGYVKILLVLGLGGLVITILLLIGLGFYVYGGERFEVLPYLSFATK